jgi:hypothetical protein
VPIAPVGEGVSFASLLPGHCAHFADRLARGGVAAPTAVQAAALPLLSRPFGPDVLLQARIGLLNLSCVDSESKA